MARSPGRLPEDRQGGGTGRITREQPRRSNNSRRRSALAHSNYEGMRRERTDIEFVVKGGPVMVLLLCSVISLSIIVERCLSLRRNRILKYDVLQRIEELLRDRKIPEASTLCKRYPSSMTRIILCNPEP